MLDKFNSLNKEQKITAALVAAGTVVTVGTVIYSIKLQKQKRALLAERQEEYEKFCNLITELPFGDSVIKSINKAYNNTNSLDSAEKVLDKTRQLYTILLMMTETERAQYVVSLDTNMKIDGIINTLQNIELNMRINSLTF